MLIKFIAFSMEFKGFSLLTHFRVQQSQVTCSSFQEVKNDMKFTFWMKFMNELFTC